MTKKTNIRLTSLAIALVLLMSLAIPFSASAEVRPATRTQSEIKAYLKAHPTDHNMPTEYKEQPSSKAPYKAGLVTDETQTYFMNAVNQVRFVAGLDEVTFDEHYRELAQAAALVNAANNEMTHYPKQPADMDDTLYALGAEGARSSNLGGRTSPAAEVFKGWMHDTDSHNIIHLGHRRWVLNPTMEKLLLVRSTTRMPCMPMTAATLPMWTRSCGRQPTCPSVCSTQEKHGPAPSAGISQKVKSTLSKSL